MSYSGRGTPNVSGRDTPSSQLEDEGGREQKPLHLTAPGRHQNQEDIEDKFGKFEIQPMMEGKYIYYFHLKWKLYVVFP